MDLRADHYDTDGSLTEKRSQVLIKPADKQLQPPDIHCRDEATPPLYYGLLRSNVASLAVHYVTLQVLVVPVESRMDLDLRITSQSLIND